MDYYYKNAQEIWTEALFRPVAHQFWVDGILVHHHYMVEWIPATVVQIDQIRPCTDDVYDVELPVPIDDGMSLMPAASRIVVGAPQDALAPYVLSAYRMRSLRVFSWLHTWDKRDSWSMVFQSTVIDVARPVRDQMLVAWASHQVRPDVTIYTMQPRTQAVHGYHPVLLLLPVDREDYVGMFVTVWTPFAIASKARFCCVLFVSQQCKGFSTF